VNEIPPEISNIVNDCILSGNLVELDEMSSNHLFETLADWEHQLKAENIDFEELGL